MMKLSKNKEKIDEETARSIEEELRTYASKESERVPPKPYWANSLVRINARIDEATSGRSLSLSWAVRVAIPGIVAIITFLIGLDYYIPDPRPTSPSMQSFFLSLPASTIDSLTAIDDGASLAVSELPTARSFSEAQIAEYFISAQASEELVETMSEEDLNSLFSLLQSRNGDIH